MGEPAAPTPERRVAVVTGANHGIGAATAIALAEAGADVLAAIAAAGGRGGALEVDLTGPGAATAVAAPMPWLAPVTTATRRSGVGTAGSPTMDPP